MGRDIRGVSRGACSQCPCNDFTATNDGNAKCAACGHVPSQHINLDSPGQAASGSLTTPSVFVPTSTKSLSSSSSSSLSGSSVAVAKPMVSVATNVCVFPGCQQESFFDPNTGEESNVCPDHILPNGELQLPQCSLPGCTRSVNIDRSTGTMYDYCSRKHGRTHILQFTQPLSANEVIPPNLKCKNPRCHRKKFQEKDGTYYDYCGRTCRDSVSQAASGPGSVSGPVCAFHGCFLPAHQSHPYCGKSHAQKALANVLHEVDQRSPEYNQVLTTFQSMWAKNHPAPNADCVFKVCSPHLETRFKQYQASLKTNTTIEHHFHGTTLACDLLSTRQACKSRSCGICGISRHGFDLNKRGTNISRFKRFGLGFYLAPNSSKCHDYTQGVTTHRSMLLCEVLPGNKYTMTQDQTSLNSAPQGYDSVYGQTGGSLNYAEIVLYQPSAILPKYVIVYQKDGIVKIAK